MTFYAFSVIVWLVVLGPFWLMGWGVLHATKHLNRLAAHWCAFLLSIYPD